MNIKYVNINHTVNEYYHKNNKYSKIYVKYILINLI